MAGICLESGLENEASACHIQSKIMMLGKADLKRRYLGFLKLTLDPVKEKTLHSWSVSYWRKPWAILRAPWDLGIMHVGASELNTLKNRPGSLLTDQLLVLVPRDLDLVDLEWCPESYTEWFCWETSLSIPEDTHPLLHTKNLRLVTGKGPVEIHAAFRLKQCPDPVHSLVPVPLLEEVCKQW